MALSTTEVEHIVATLRCSQLPYIKQQVKDFILNTGCILIFYDNNSAMNIAKIIVYRKRKRHINVRHHFLKDDVEKDFISLKLCSTDKHVIDTFYKALAGDHFKRNRLELG